MTEGLAGKRILIIEDEYFIASDIKRAITSEGAVAVGPAGTLATAMALAEEDIDLALLDVNLEGEHSYPIANRLRDRAVPFAFLTGYDDWALPEAYRDVPRFGKPFGIAQLISGLESLAPAGRS